MPSLHDSGLRAFGVCLDLIGGEALASNQSLYLTQGTSQAAPKCISGSTSYLRVLLAFHSYPHLIQKLFNAYWFGPPSGVTRTSTWTRVDHLVSRLPIRTKRPIRTRFRFGSTHLCAYPRTERQLVGSLCKRHAVTPYWCSDRL